MSPESAPAGLDVERALSFLRTSRSSFVRAAAGWLSDFADPVDVLLMLSGDVGQRLGPWETFRFCAVLGLEPTPQVRELGLDVLAEPMEEDDVPPIAQGVAIAWASSLWPAEAAPFAVSTREALTARRDHPRGHPALVAGALLGLAAPSGAAPEAAAFALARGALVDAASTEVAGPVLEAAHLCGDPAVLTQALELVERSQQPDGGLLALGGHDALRGFSTLRALGVTLRRGGSSQ